MRTRHRMMVLAVVAVAAVLASGTALGAGTLLSDDFEDGNLAGWNATGDGTWTVISDDTRVLNQGYGSSENSRLFTGNANWSSYTVQARVKPITFAVGSHIGLLARAGGPTKFYRLAILPGNTAQLHAVNGNSVTILASTTHAIDTLTWYTLSLEVTGTTIRASIDGTPILQATSTLASAGHVGIQTTYATASFDDITVTTPLNTRSQ